MRSFRLVVSSLVCLSNLLAIVPAYSSELQLTYEVVTTNIERKDPANASKDPAKAPAKEPQEKQPNTSTPTRTTKIIFLGPDYVCVQEGDTKHIFDFAKNRILSVDLAKRTYQDHSLFSVIAFKSAEMKNRMMLSSVIKAVGGELPSGGAFDSFSAESLFSLSGPGNNAGQVETTQDGTQTIFKHKDRVVTVFRPSSTECGTYSDMFQKFMIYCCSLHPSIRKQIEGFGKFPQTLQFEVDSYPENAQTVEFRLMGKEESSVGHAAEVPTDLSRTLDSDNPMLPVLEATKNLTNSRPPTQDDVVAQAEKFLAANDSLDAMLTLVELSLASGDKLSEKGKELMKKAQTDERCKLLVSSLVPRSEEEAEQAIKNLDSLDKPGVKKAYLLNVFRANILQRKNGDIAKKLLANAVKNNPYLTGAFKDLGDLYYSRYEMQTAWDCWDMGRQFYPQHPMMRDVNHMETSFQDAFSEFFLKKK